MLSLSLQHRRALCSPLVAVLAACAATEPTSPGSDRPSAELASLALDPDSIYVVQGDSVELTPIGRTVDGQVVRPDVQWHAEGGTLDAAGRFTAGFVPGTYTITAASSGHLAAVTVFIDYHIVGIVITPSSVTLAPGATQQFVARGVDVTGDTVAIEVIWSATGGTITPGGLFTLGSSGTPAIVAELAPPSVNGVPVEWAPRRAGLTARRG